MFNKYITRRSPLYHIARRKKTKHTIQMNHLELNHKTTMTCISSSISLHVHPRNILSCRRVVDIDGTTYHASLFKRSFLNYNKNGLQPQFHYMCTEKLSVFLEGTLRYAMFDAQLTCRYAQLSYDSSVGKKSVKIHNFLDQNQFK